MRDVIPCKLVASLLLKSTVVMLCLLAACESTGADIFPFPTYRNVSSFFRGNGEFEYSGGEYTAGAPFQLRVHVTGGSDSEKDKDRTNSAGHISKIEVDFGDGSGWQDYSSYKLQWDAQDSSTWPSHTYATPGEYDPVARVTYWDGEVLYQDERFAVHVSVLAPTE